MKLCLMVFVLLPSVGLQSLEAQDRGVPSLDDRAILKDAQLASVQPSNISSSNLFSTLPPDVFNRLGVGQSFASVTNMLGRPPIIAPAIDLGSKHEHIPSTARWYVVYMHSQSDKIYYQMLFSGENGRPARLLTVEAFLALGKLRVLVSVLSLAGGDRVTRTLLSAPAINSDERPSTNGALGSALEIGVCGPAVGRKSRQGGCDSR